MITLVTTKSMQEGTMTANGGTQAYLFVDSYEFLAETQPRKNEALAKMMNSWVMKHGSIIKNHALNNRIRSGNIPHLWRLKNSSPMPLQVKWCCYCFGTLLGLEHYLKQDTAVTIAMYTEILKSKLKQAICNKCRSLPSKWVILLHDTICLHYAAATTEAIGQLKF